MKITCLQELTRRDDISLRFSLFINKIEEKEN